MNYYGYLYVSSEIVNDKGPFGDDKMPENPFQVVQKKYTYRRVKVEKEGQKPEEFWAKLEYGSEGLTAVYWIPDFNKEKKLNV